MSPNIDQATTTGSGSGTGAIERAAITGAGGSGGGSLGQILERAAEHGVWKVFWAHTMDMLFYSGLTPIIVLAMVGFYAAAAFAPGALALSNAGSGCLGALIQAYNSSRRTQPVRRTRGARPV